MSLPQLIRMFTNKLIFETYKDFEGNTHISTWFKADAQNTKNSQLKAISDIFKQGKTDGKEFEETLKKASVQADEFGTSFKKAFDSHFNETTGYAGVTDGLREMNAELETATKSSKNLGKGLGDKLKNFGKTLLSGFGNMAISFAASELANLAMKGIDQLLNWDKYAAEKASASYQEYAATQMEIESINTELETTKTRMQELKGIGTLTLTEQEELNRLKETNDELERQKKIKENTAESQSAKAEKDALEAFYANRELSFDRSKNYKAMPEWLAYVMAPIGGLGFLVEPTLNAFDTGLAWRGAGNNYADAIYEYVEQANKKQKELYELQKRFDKGEFDGNEDDFQKQATDLQSAIDSYSAKLGEFSNFLQSDSIKALLENPVTEEGKAAQEYINSALDAFEGYTGNIEQRKQDILDTLQQNIVDDAKFNEIKSWVDDLSYEEIKFLFQIDDIGEMSLEELQAQLEKMTAISDADGYKAKIKTEITGDDETQAWQKNFNDFIDGLSNGDLSLLYDVIIDGNWDATAEGASKVQKEFEALKESMETISEAEKFDFTSQSEGMEKYLKALQESVSATGLSADAIKDLTQRYKVIDGFEPAKLFEKTTTGIHLNAKALKELESEYQSYQKKLIDNQLEDLVDKYNNLTDAIDNCSDASKLQQLYDQRDSMLTEIDDVAELASQYAGLTSAYNQWIESQNGANERDPYENIGKGYESVKDLINRGWVTDSDVSKYLDLLIAADQRTNDNERDFKKLTKTIEGTNFSLMDFFQYDENDKLVTDGLYNFLDTVKAKLGDEFVKIDKEGNYSFDFTGDKLDQVAKKLGTTTEFVQLLERALTESGAAVTFDSPIVEIGELKKGAKDCVEILKTLKEEGTIDFEIGDFNFHTENLDDAQSEIDKAKELLNHFTGKDGKVDLTIEGAQEAVTILETLIRQKQELDAPAIMLVDTSRLSKADQEMGNAVTSLQEFIRLSNDLAVQTEFGVDTSETQNKIKEVADKLKNLPEEVKTELQIDAAAFDSAIQNLTEGTVDINGKIVFNEEARAALQSSIASIQANNIEILAKFTPDTSELDGAVEDNEDINVNYHPNTNELPESFDDIIRSVNYVARGLEWLPKKFEPITQEVRYFQKVSAGANGTAHARGTAFASGNWGAPRTERALTGELGEELVVFLMPPCMATYMKNFI